LGQELSPHIPRSHTLVLSGTHVQILLSNWRLKKKVERREGHRNEEERENE